MKVVAVPYEANARGVVSMGLVSEGKTYSEMAEGGMDVLYTIGEVPISKRPSTDFLIAQTSYLTDLAREADVVLPAASYLESKGTIINYLGRIKDVNRVIEPAGSSRQHKDIFIELSKIAGSPIKESAAKIKAAFDAGTKPSFSPFEKEQGMDLSAADVMESMNVNVIRNSRLAWFEEAMETAAK
jgi:anaerobic selenocysteine-containing dehydrogenase